MGLCSAEGIVGDDNVGTETRLQMMDVVTTTDGCVSGVGSFLLFKHTVNDLPYAMDISLAWRPPWPWPLPPLPPLPPWPLPESPLPEKLLGYIPRPLPLGPAPRLEEGPAPRLAPPRPPPRPTPTKDELPSPTPPDAIPELPAAVTARIRSTGGRSMC